MKIFAKSIFVLLLLNLCSFCSVIAQEITREEVVFKSGEHVLGGTLILPQESENVPVLVFTGGVDEWGDIYPQRKSFIEQNLEAIFLRSGIGIFYYDPRGTGQSDGRWHRTALEGLPMTP